MAGEYDTATISAHFAAISRRFELVESQLALLSEKLGVPFTPASSGVPSEVVELARSGKGTEAVAKYRALTNASLDEARNVVAGL